MSRKDQTRDQILGAVRRALHRGSLGAEQRANLEGHLSRHPRGPLPARSQGSREELVERFLAMAEEVSATTQRLERVEEVPEAVAAYLQDHNLPARLRIAPDPLLRALDWSGRAPILEVSEGVGEGATLAGLVQGFAGVAETGTLMIPSGAENPISLNFLPDSHLVILPARAVVGSYEEAWDRLRARQAQAGESKLPRTVNLITGPSRTADIEQTLQLGAHGPRRLHIILVDDGLGDDGLGDDDLGDKDGIGNDRDYGRA